MEFRLLGPLEVLHDGSPVRLPSGKQLALLANLLLHANRAVAVERLVDDLWGDDVPGTAVKAVQVYVSKLRKALPERRLHTKGRGYLLEVGEGELDLHRFERLFGEGRDALAAGDAATAAARLEEALGLWRGRALAEFEEPFALAEEARLVETRLSCLEARIDADLQLGRHAALVGELEALASRHPLRERPRRQLILALYRSGRQAEALDVYQAFRRILDEELGIEPSQQLRELERRILRQDPDLDAPAVPAPAPRVPVPRRVEREVREGPVGRDVELQHLRRLVDEASRGARRVAFVTGEAGAGKTTLVEAFLAEIADGDAAPLQARGQCIEHRGAGEPYLPVLDAVSRLVREGDDVVTAILRAQAPSWVVQLPWLVDDDDELENLRSRALGVTRDRMLRELVEGFDAVAAHRPLVLVLEDLHWSDVSTLDLLDAIARRDVPARLLVLGTFRRGDPGPEAEAVAQLERALRIRNLASELALGALSGDAVQAYLERRLPGLLLPPEVVGSVRARTNGNPLFVEHLVGSWVERGSVVEREGRWQLVGSPAELSEGVPESVRALIDARCDGLAPVEQNVLETACAVGTEFSSALAAAAAGTSDEETEAVLARLAKRGLFIGASGEEAWPDGTVTSTYVLVHDLCRDALWERVPAGRRARVHERIGRRLEAAFGEQSSRVSAELAWHFLQANDAERAVRHLAAAAEQALRRTAPREALGHLHEALAALPAVHHAESRARLELALGDLLAPALILTEGWSSPRVEETVQRSRRLALELGDADALARALTALGALYEVRGEYERSQVVIEELLSLPVHPPSDRRIVDSHELLACTLVHQGRFEPALEHAERAVAHATGVYSDALVVFGESPGISAHVWASLALWGLGRPDLARERVWRAVSEAALVPRAHGRAMAEVEAAFVAQHRGEPLDALRWAETGLASAEQAGFPYWLGAATVVRGWAVAASGLWEPSDALAELREGLELARSTGARLDDAYFLGLAADVCRIAGLVDEGLEAIAEAQSSLPAGRAFFFEPELHRLRAELLYLAGEDAEGRAALEAALQVARAGESPMLELRTAVALARRLAGDGDGEAAAALLSPLYARFTEGFDTPDLRSARELLEELGTPPAAPVAAPAPVPAPVRGPVRYARAGALNVAYQVSGEGPVDLVLVPGFVSHLEKDWEEPRHARFLDRLSSFARLIRFDKRDTGLSDRPGDIPDLETRMDDVRAVMDAVGSERAVLFGYSEGGPMSIFFAATHPERVRALVLYGAFAKRLDPDDDYPWAPTREERRAYIERLGDDWGFEADMHVMCPTADDAMARWWGERCRAAASPSSIKALMETNSLVDVRGALGTVYVPTLVVHRGTDFDVRVEEGRYIAERIPGARFVELEGSDHFVAIDPDQILDVVEPFVAEITGAPLPEPAASRTLATLLMTDVVGSTELLTRIGDRRWVDRLERHDALVREELARFAGRVVNHTGDGFFAAFDGPARAIHCAVAIRDRLAPLGLDVRIGIHTGEVERHGADLRGAAVHLVARAAQQAGAGEILVTGTTHDLVEGAGIRFDDRGEHALKGFERPRRLFSVVDGRAVSAVRA